MNAPEPNDIVLKTKSYVPGKPLDIYLKERGLSECIKLDANENPFGFSVLVERALAKKPFHRYPDGGCIELRNKLSSLLGISHENILISPGSNHLVELVIRTYLKPGGNTITAEKTFSLYRLFTTRNTGEIIETPLKNGFFDLETIVNSINEKTNIIFICNPNNPTGTLLPFEELENFIRRVDSKIVIVVDEAYIEYAEEAAKVDDIVRDYPNLLVVRTFSKIYGLAGFRIGYAIGNAKLIEEVGRLIIPFSVSAPALIAASAALDGTDFVEETYKNNFIEKRKLQDFFTRQGYFFYESQSNFIFVKLPFPDAGKKLEDKAILIRNLESFGFDKDTYRISIGNSNENNALINVLKSFK